MRKCKQINCAFLKLKQGCRKCGDCGVIPFMVSEDCLRCDSCENIQGSCRWDDEKDIEQKQEEMIIIR